MAAGTSIRSYRSDPDVPQFPDEKPLIVFDGVCVLCSSWMKFVIRHDHPRAFRFVIAQSPLGQALYKHYQLNPVDFETNLVLSHGRLYTKLDAFAEVMRLLPWPWSLLQIARWVPQALADWLYDRIALNRYRIFGRTSACLVPTPDLRERFPAGGS